MSSSPVHRHTLEDHLVLDDKYINALPASRANTLGLYVHAAIIQYQRIQLEILGRQRLSSNNTARASAPARFRQELYEVVLDIRPPQQAKKTLQYSDELHSNCISELSHTNTDRAVQLSEANAQLREVLSVTQTETAALKDNMEQEKEKVPFEVHHLQQEIKTLETSNADKVSQIAELSALYTQQATELQETKTQLQDALAAASESKTVLALQVTRFIDLSIAHETQVTQLTDTQKQLEDALAVVSALKAAKVEFDSENKSLMARLAAAELDAQSKASRITEMGEELAKVKLERDNLLEERRCTKTLIHDLNTQFHNMPQLREEECTQAKIDRIACVAIGGMQREVGAEGVTAPEEAPVQDVGLPQVQNGAAPSLALPMTPLTTALSDEQQYQDAKDSSLTVAIVALPTPPATPVTFCAPDPPVYYEGDSSLSPISKEHEHPKAPVRPALRVRIRGSRLLQQALAPSRLDPTVMASSQPARTSYCQGSSVPGDRLASQQRSKSLANIGSMSSTV